MKYLNVFFLVISLSLFSCSSDDDSVEISASIVGTWTAIDVEFDGSATSTGQGQNKSLTFTGEPMNLDHTLTFNESPNTVIPKGGFDLEITYSLNGQSETQTAEASSIVDVGTWEQSGNQLTITDSENERGIIEIFELTETRLVIGTVEEAKETLNGTTTTLTSSIKIIYVR
jgi:hypothetical protein